MFIYIYIYTHNTNINEKFKTAHSCQHYNTIIIIIINIQDFNYGVPSSRSTQRYYYNVCLHRVIINVKFGNKII